VGYGVAKTEERLEDDAMRVLKELVGPLCEALGPGNEVVVHDLRHVEQSVVAIAGSVTNRTVGAPATDLILEQLQLGASKDMFGYRTRTKGGRQLRSSTFFLRDEEGVPYGCVCINTDVTDLLRLNETLGTMLAGSVEVPLGEDESTSEDFVVSVEDLVVGNVNRTIEEVGVPVAFMRKEHRAEVVRRLDEVGFFLLRDAVMYAAKALQVSQYSIYKYLRELHPSDSEGNQLGSTRHTVARPLPMPDTPSSDWPSGD
jgi:predicted transcriptional regulator YheO